MYSRILLQVQIQPLLPEVLVTQVLLVETLTSLVMKGVE